MLPPAQPCIPLGAVSYTHLRAHETRNNLVCRLLLISFGGGLLLLLLLCLGAQNLQDRHTLQLGGQRSVPLPTGFLVGLAMVIGVISGGTATAVLLPDQPERLD